MSQTSTRRVNIVINGKAYLVEVGDLAASPLTVMVNGQPYVVRIENVEAGTTFAKTPAALETIARQTSAPPKAPPPVGPAGPAVGEVRAPMPGNILDIAVQAGDKVRFGQPLCALEAMKMKSAIRSPRDGVIAEVKVAEGQSVGYGDILFTFE